MTKVVALGTVLIVSLAFGSASAASAPSSRSGANDQDATKTVCRRPVADVSSRIPPRKDCRTKAAWEEEARDHQQNLQRQERMAATPPQ